MKKLRVETIISGKLRACARASHIGRLLFRLGLICMASMPIASWAQSSWPNYPNNTSISVSSAGNVGIGTANPRYKFEVDGNYVSTVLNDPLATVTAGGLVRYASLGTGSYAYQINTAAAGDFSSAINAYTVAANGAVGIGTASPLAPLHVRTGTNRNVAFLSMDWTGLTGSIGLDAFNDANNTYVPLAFTGNPIFLGGGNVGIGTTSPQHLLHVAGTIGAEEVIVSSTGADYVFDPGYHLTPLDEVDRYIKQNGHLPRHTLSR